MSIRMRRLLLLSSSVLLALCFTGVAWSQTTSTPAEAAQTTTPASEAPAPQATPPTPQPTPETPPAVPGAAPLPQVTVEAPRRRPARQAAPAAPARSTTPSAPRTTPTTTTPTAPSPAAQPTAAAASSFQPTPALDTVTSNQMQASQAQSFGDLFFTKPGATSAGLAPGAARARRFPRARAGERHRLH